MADSERRCQDCGKLPERCWLPPDLCKHPDRTMKRPLHIDVQRLHELHAARMAEWELSYDDDYQFDVVHRVVDWARDVKPEPVAHPHQQQEIGMCLECDAAALAVAYCNVR